MPKVERQYTGEFIDNGTRLEKQIWVGATNGLEIHFAVVGDDGALCFRTGGGHKDAMRMHWLDEDRSRTGRTMESCPLLDGQQCWIDQIDETNVEAAGQHLIAGGDRIWQFLANTYRVIRVDW